MKNFTRIFLGLLLVGQYAVAQTEFVPIDQVKNIADRKAQSLWGQVAAAEPLLYYSSNDELIGYRFTYAINKPFPDKKFLMQQCRDAASRADKRAQWGNEEYGTIFVSARKDMAVIQQRANVLSPEYAVGAIMEAKATEMIGGSISLKRAYYIDFQNQWFCYTNGIEDIYVKPFPKLTAVNYTEFHGLVDQLDFFTATGDFTDEWNKYLSGQMDAPAAAVMIPNHDGNCKYYDWSYGCSPTAAAMLLSYWDYKSAITVANYSKLVDYHYSRWDGIQGEYDYQVPNTNKELAIAMNTDTIVEGGTSRSDIVPGYNSVCNTTNGYSFINTDYGEESYTTCWNRIVTEVGTNDRPIHVSIPGHSECCVGYDAATLEIAVHNTWWEGIDWQTRTQLERVYTIVPGGSEGYSIVLQSPLGDVIYNHNGSGETYFAGDVYEIRWNYDYAAASYVKLYYSINGGGVWYTITSNTPNDGVYDWRVPAGLNSTNCRIRALVYSSTNVFSGSDGSTGNFKIYSGGSLYNLGEDSYTSTSTDPDYYQFTSSAGYWNVVGIRPNISTEDWDIALFDDIDFTTQLASSSYGGSTVDFVVLDGNHASSLARGIKASRYSGSGTGRVEWEGGTDLITPSSPMTETWTAGDVVEMWDVYLTPGYYKCTMLMNSGTADMGMALYGSSGVAYYAGRGAYLALADSYAGGVGESFWVTITTSDYYGLCIFAKDLGTANITVKFETQGQWLGDVSNDWFNPDNWSAAFVPTSTVDVTISSGYTYYPSISSGVAACQNITIGTGTKISIASADLNVSGNMTIYGQVEQTNANADFNVTGSVLWESGSTANIIAGEFHVDMNWEFRAGANAQLANGYVFFDGTEPYSYMRIYDAGCAFKNVYNNKTAGYLYYSSSSADTLKINGFYSNLNATSLFYSNTNYPLVLKGQLTNNGHIYCPYGTFIFDGTTHNIDLNTGDYFNNIVISSSGNVTMLDSLRVHGDLTINSGALVSGNYPILIERDWTNIVGTAGFSEGTGKVVFNGGNHHQYCSSETFYELEVNKPLGGAFRMNGTNVVCQNYDWTAGAVDVLAGSFTANNLVDYGISGNYYVNSGGTINLHNLDGYVDLNGYIYIYGGNFNVYSNAGYGDSFWPWSANGGITMSGGTLDFKNTGILVNNTASYTFSENITNGTIRTYGGFRVERADYTPAGGTVEFYGPVDGTFHAINGGSVWNVIFNKGALDNIVMNNNPVSYDRETPAVADAPLANTVNIDNIADINGSVTIQNGAVFVPSSTIYVAGNWDNQLGTNAFLEGYSTVEFDGANAADIISAETFFNLNLNKTYTLFDGLELFYDVTVSNDLHLIDGTLELNNPGDLFVAGNLTIDNGAGLNGNDAYGPQIYIGKNWINANASYSTENGFDPGVYSTVKFNGSAAEQTLITASTVESFSTLAVDKSAGKFRPYNNIQCNRDILITNGSWEDATSGLSHGVWRNFTVASTGAYLTSLVNNTLEFNGSLMSTLTYSSATGYFRHLLINKAPGNSVTQATSASCQNSGNLTVNAGTYNLNGNFLSVFGNVVVNSGGTLSLPASSTLVLTDTKSLNVNTGGVLSVLGTAVNPVTIRANVSTYRYALNINTGATIAAEYCTFKNTGANGVYVAPGSTVDPAHTFNGCTFQDGAAGGTMLALNNSQVMTIRNAVFPTNTWGGNSNVAKTLNTGHVYFVDFSGGFSGEGFDADGWNLIDWIQTLTATAIATPGTICAGASSQLNVNQTGGLGPFSYQWSPTTGLSNPAIINPVATPGSSITYNVTVTDFLGTTKASSIAVTVNPYLPVVVSITASANPSPPGNLVTFTAAPVNGGSLPSYQWKVNEVNAGTGLPTFSYVPSNNNQVKCILTSNYQCPTGNPATSNIITMVIVNTNTTAFGTLSSGTTVCYDASNTITVAGPAGPFVVQSGGIARMIAGMKISYLYGTSVLPGGYLHGWITKTNAYCGSLPPAMVAVATGEDEPVTGITPELGQFTIYPNPATGTFTLMSKSLIVPGEVQVGIYNLQGSMMLRTVYTGERSHLFNITGFSPGLYFVKVKTAGQIESFKLIVIR